MFSSRLCCCSCPCSYVCFAPLSIVTASRSEISLVIYWSCRALNHSDAMTLARTSMAGRVFFSQVRCWQRSFTSTPFVLLCCLAFVVRSRRYHDCPCGSCCVEGGWRVSEATLCDSPQRGPQPLATPNGLQPLPGGWHNHNTRTLDQRHAEFPMCTSQKRTCSHCWPSGGSHLA